jgi:pantothenate kinase
MAGRSAALAEVAAQVEALLARGSGRVLVGVAGAPGAGKSTLAAALARRFADRGAMAVPMDGFHLANEELARLGLAHVKGAPETFDGYGFVHLMRRLRDGQELVYAPLFHRRIEQAIASALPVPPTAEVVIVEGNYLLLPEQPWALARPLFDLAVYLDVPAEIRVPRLLDRARAGGRDEAAAQDWVHRNDEANAAVVAATRDRADLVISAVPAASR